MAVLYLTVVGVTGTPLGKLTLRAGECLAGSSQMKVSSNGGR